MEQQSGVGRVLGAALGAERPPSSAAVGGGVGVVLVLDDVDRGVVVGLDRGVGRLVLGALLHALADVLDGLAQRGADLGQVLGPKDDEDDDEDDERAQAMPQAKNQW